MSYRLKHNIDIRTAISVLQKLSEQGKRVISVKELLCLSAPRIAHKEEVMKKLRDYSKVRIECNCNELSNFLGISRQTIYNWMERGYLILNQQKKILILDTYNYWLIKEVESKAYRRKYQLWEDVF